VKELLGVYSLDNCPFRMWVGADLNMCFTFLPYPANDN
jgi:hypothetical protein